MQKRLLLYGGTSLPPELSAFVEELTYSILQREKAIIITGGFLRFHGNASTLSTDASALRGVKRFAKEKHIPLENCLETWLPDTLNDRRLEGVERFAEGKVITLFGELASARRFAMVKHVDTVITVSGKDNTELVLEFAKAIEKPVLPLPFSGGDSENYWPNHKKTIVESFGIPAALQYNMETFQYAKASQKERHTLIEGIVGCLDVAFANENKRKNNYSPEQMQLNKIGVTADADAEQLKKANPFKKKRPAVFVSYAHEDIKWKEEFDKHITQLKRNEAIQYWNDRMLQLGATWNQVIIEELEKADIVLLFVTPYFISSKYIQEIELAIAAKKQKNKSSIVIPLFITAVDIEGSIIQDLQGFPKGKTISSYKDDSDRAELWHEFVSMLKLQIKNWQIHSEG